MGLLGRCVSQAEWPITFTVAVQSFQKLPTLRTS